MKLEQLICVLIRTLTNEHYKSDKLQQRKLGQNFVNDVSGIARTWNYTHTHTHEFITFIAARLILITNGKIHRISRRSLFQLISIRFLLQSKTIAKYLGLGRMYLFVLNFNCVFERERKSVKPAKCWCCFTCFMTSKVTKAPESALYDPENTLKTFPMKCRMHR